MSKIHPNPPKLFPPFLPHLWNSANDSLRGGLSFSSLALLSPTEPSASPLIFKANINSQPLGAGFASQYFTFPAPGLDLTEYNSLIIDVVNRSERMKTLTITLRDDVESGITFERHVELKAAGEGGNEGRKGIVLAFGEFKGTRRGRVVEGVELDKGKVRRVGVMVRSFFGGEGQEGEVELEIGGMRWGKEGEEVTEEVRKTEDIVKEEGAGEEAREVSCWVDGSDL